MSRIIISPSHLDENTLSNLLNPQYEHGGSIQIKYTGSGGYVKALQKISDMDIPDYYIFYDFRDNASGVITNSTVGSERLFLEDMKNGKYDKNLTKSALKSLNR